MDKIYFVVEMLRYNDRESHSYIIGIFDDELEALTEAWEHMKMRDGKYGAEISGYRLGIRGEKVYERTLDSWDAFAASTKVMAENLRKLINDPEELDGLRVKKE